MFGFQKQPPGKCNPASSHHISVALQMAHLLTPDLIQSLHQLRQQQPQQQRHPHQQQAWPGAPPSGSHMLPHSMMGPVIAPPRPPQGPPPPGQPPHLPHSGYGPPNFGPMTSNAMDGRPYQSPPQDPQGFRHRQGPPGWSLSHGMDGSDRPGNRQEPMLAADMVWDSDAGQGHPRFALCKSLISLLFSLGCNTITCTCPDSGCQTRCKYQQSFASCGKCWTVA